MQFKINDLRMTFHYVTDGIYLTDRKLYNIAFSVENRVL